MEASYEYTSLSHSRATRLIRLYPDANEDAPLGCELEEVSVDEPLPPYVALSYTWNNEEPSVKLKISASAGGDPAVTRILLITPNCAAALKVLRNSDLVQQHELWIDAICINQACNDEKGDQVAMMATIYDEAKHVLVWLGSEWAPKTYQDVAPFDKRWLRKVCEFHNGLKGCMEVLLISLKRHAFRPTLRSMIIQSNTSARPLTDDLRLVIDKEVLMHMMKAPYWARAWTFQETMNPSTKLLCQDSRHCPVYVLWYGLQQISFSRSWQHGLDLRIHLHTKKHLEAVDDRLTLLRARLRVKATDPRDKVHAFRAFLPNSLGKMTVNYNSSVVETYSDATKHYITGHSDLLVLYETLRYPQTTPGLPSWVLDWAVEDVFSTRPFHHAYVKTGCASNGSPPLHHFSYDNTKLYLTGKKIGEIGSRSDQFTSKLHHEPLTGSVIDREVYKKEITRSFLILSEFIVAEPPAGMEVATVEYKFKAFQRVVLRLTRDGSPLTWTTEFLLNQKLFNPKDSDKTALEAGLSSYFVKWHIATTFRSACPFLTTDGRFGLGYCALDSGDSICVFSGLPTPLILRPCGLGWKIMGLAHVDGSLDGETWPENEDGLEQWEIV